LKTEGVGVIETEKCILNKVLYADLLLLVSEITENGGKIIFTKKKVEI